MLDRSYFSYRFSHLMNLLKRQIKKKISNSLNNRYHKYKLSLGNRKDYVLSPAYHQ